MSAGPEVLGEVAEGRPALAPAVAATELKLAQGAFDDALSKWWEHSAEELGVLAADLWYALKALREAIAA